MEATLKMSWMVATTMAMGTMATLPQQMCEYFVCTSASSPISMSTAPNDGSGILSPSANVS